jgi:hypothetical protein
MSYKNGTPIELPVAELKSITTSQINHRRYTNDDAHRTLSVRPSGLAQYP